MAGLVDAGEWDRAQVTSRHAWTAAYQAHARIARLEDRVRALECSARQEANEAVREGV
jgi:hypothetical protein